MKLLWSNLSLEGLYTDADTDNANDNNNTWWTEHDCIGSLPNEPKREKKQPKDNSFQDHMDTSYMDTRSMLFDEPNLHQAPPTSPPRCYSPRSPSCSPPASSPSRESSMEPSSEDSSSKGRNRHQSEPAFIIPCDIDRGLTHGLSALLAETSTLAPYRIQQQAKVKAQEKISTQKWLLSRPLHLDHLVVKPPWTVI